MIPDGPRWRAPSPPGCSTPRRLARSAAVARQPAEPRSSVVPSRPMTIGSVEPSTNVLRLDESSTLRTHRYVDRFSVVRVKTTGPLPNAVHKSSSVPALLVSTFLRPVPAPDYRL